MFNNFIFTRLNIVDKVNACPNAEVTFVCYVDYLRDHSFSTFAKLSEKLTFPTP